MPIPHVNPGEAWRPNAAKENAFIDAANAYAANRSRQGPGDVEARRREPHIIWGRNDSTTSFGIFYVVGFGDRIFPPTGDGFATFPGLHIQAPVSASAPFGILQEPIDGKTATGSFSGVNAIVKKCVQVGGMTPVRLKVNDPSHAYARPIAGDPTQLESATAGPARILYKDAAGSIVWAYVLIGEQIGDPYEDPDGPLGPKEYVVFDEAFSLDGELLAAHVVRESIVGRFVNWARVADVWASQINQGVPIVGRRYFGRRSRRSELVDGKPVYLAEECDCTSGSDGSGSEGSGSSGSDGSSGSSGSSGTGPITSCTGSTACPDMLTDSAYATLQITVAANSTTYTLTRSGSVWSWTSMGQSISFVATCISGVVSMNWSGQLLGVGMVGGPVSLYSCDPFYGEGSGAIVFL